MPVNEREPVADPLDADLRDELADYHGEALMRALMTPALVLVGQIGLVVVIALTFSNRQDAFSSRLPPPPAATPPHNQVFQLELPPLADAFVQQDAAQKNHGDGLTLEASQSPGPRRHVLLKFDVPDLTGGEVVGAALRLHPATDWGDGNPDLKLVQCATEWQEMTVAWRTLPDFFGLVGYLPGGTLTGTTPAEIPIDVGVVAAGEPLALAVELVVPGQSAAFASREVAGKAPLLVLDVHGDPPPSLPAPAF